MHGNVLVAIVPRMLRQHAFVEGETYHIYNRGAHKSPIFTNESDYTRFMLLLHVGNETKSIHFANLLDKYKGRSFMEIFDEYLIENRLVEVLSFSLMPNHFHLILRQKAGAGITKFMKKISTAYSMYFNAKYEHSGVLFQGRFKSKCVNTESYFRYIFSYVHLNPLELFEPKWKEKGIQNKKGAREFLNTYPYSSFRLYPRSTLPESHILSKENIPDFLKTQNDLDELLQWQDMEDGPLWRGLTSTNRKG